MAYSVRDIARKIGADVVGDGDAKITHVADLENSTAGSLSFAISRKYIKQLQRAKATAVIVPADLVAHCEMVTLVTDNPSLSFARAVQFLHPPEEIVPGIHPTAIISDDCEVAENVSIGPNVVINAKCTIGNNSVIGPGCIITAPCFIGAYARLIARVSIVGPASFGERVIIHPGAVVGSDGFGLANDQGVWVKIPQIGGVIIGNDVEIGANTTIDRGALQDTVIDDGVKLDNQIQVAHNVKIGAQTAVAGCTGIAGSAKIGKHCAIGAAVGIQGHIEIADGVVVTGMATIRQSISKPGVYSSGTLPQENKKWIRSASRFKELDNMLKRLQELEKKMARE